MSEGPPPHVYGPVVDAEMRCVHWASPRDVVAVQFACCRRFYPCYDCHQAGEDSGGAGHPPTTWPREDFQHRAILCGACKSLLSIEEYLRLYAEPAHACASHDPPPPPRCPHCAAPFNPGCRKHMHLYFSVDQQALKHAEGGAQQASGVDT